MLRLRKLIRNPWRIAYLEKLTHPQKACYAKAVEKRQHLRDNLNRHLWLQEIRLYSNRQPCFVLCYNLFSRSKRDLDIARFSFTSICSTDFWLKNS